MGGRIWLTLEQFDELLDYSCSIPTGQTIGKRWKRHEPYVHDPKVKTVWYMGQYVDHEDPDKIGIRWTLIDRVDGQNPADLLKELGRSD